MRTLGQFIGVLLIVGFVGAYFWWIAVAAVGVGLVYYGPRVWRAYCARVAEVEAAHQAALEAVAKRADQQHAWVMAGDPRGTYGEP